MPGTAQPDPTHRARAARPGHRQDRDRGPAKPGGRDPDPQRGPAGARAIDQPGGRAGGQRQPRPAGRHLSGAPTSRASCARSSSAAARSSSKTCPWCPVPRGGSSRSAMSRRSNAARAPARPTSRTRASPPRCCSFSVRKARTHWNRRVSFPNGWPKPAPACSRVSSSECSTRRGSSFATASCCSWSTAAEACCSS